MLCTTAVLALLAAGCWRTQPRFGSGNRPLFVPIRSTTKSRRDLHRFSHAEARQGTPDKTEKYCVLCALASYMGRPDETVVDESWRVQLFIATRDGNLEVTFNDADVV